MGRKVMFVLVVLLLLLNSCGKEEVAQMQEGRVSFSFVMEDGAGTKSVDENLIKNLNLYVVNSAGGVQHFAYLNNPGRVDATIWKDETYSVYVVANAGLPILKNTLNDIENIALTYFSTKPMPPSAILMSGKMDPKVLADGQEVVIPLQRAMAKIVVKCDFSQLFPGVDLNIKSVRLRNVPNVISLFKQNALVYPSNSVAGFSIADPTPQQLQQGLEFYQYENMQGTLLPGNTDQKLKVWPQGSPNSQLCSYVEIEAEYASNEKQGPVIYRFYMGSDMTTNYDVQRNRQYTVSVFFKGNGGIDENTWRVDAGGLVDALPPQVSFQESRIVMYDLEERNLPFAQLEARGRELQIASSDNSVLQVLDYGEDGVKLRALAPGEATLTATAGEASAECKVNVEKLRIVPSSPSVTLFNHFYEDLGYEIYPPHAASLGVSLRTGAASLAVGYGGVQNRVIPQYDMNTPLPLEAEVTLSVAGRGDASATIPVCVKPMISSLGTVAVNANMGNSVTVKDIGLETSPHASVSTSWAPSDGISIYGTPPDGVAFSNGKIMVDVPTAANGRYRLVCSVVGDDGYGSAPDLQNDAVAYCNVDIYETVYLVGVSKTHGRERMSVSPDRWKYSNEVVAKWFSHPQSLIFPNGEVPLNLSFIYNGVEYTDSHTAFYEEKTFEFEEGESYEYAMDEGSFVYKGTPPKCYYQYFFLQPASSPYIEGSLPDNSPYIYICSRNFASGFGKDDAPGWSTVFEYIYPQ